MKSVKMSDILILALGLAVCLTASSVAVSMNTAFTCQGRLMDSNSVADGLYDFQFRLFDDPCTGNQQGVTVEGDDLDVIDGYFTVELDFGSNVFDGDSRWLDIGVRPFDSNEPNAFVSLIPRQELTPVPYALYAEGSDWDNLNNMPAGFADGIDHTGSGDITSVVAGTGLNGGGLSGSVTLNVDIPLVLSGTDLNGIIVATNDDSRGTGIMGISENGKAGVSGEVTDTGTGISFGVMGTSYSGEGRGVYGYANAAGAYTNYGGYFESEGGMGVGVYGEAFGSDGIGVYGRADANVAHENFGGYFEAAGLHGKGVYGKATQTGIFTDNYGGYFETAGGLGAGVYGECTATDGPGHGGYFETSSEDGTGVLGVASSLTGTTYGVRGLASSSLGYGGYFIGRGYFSGNVGIGTLSPSTELEVNGAITASGGNSANWNTAYNWGNHATQGYLTSEVDPQVGAISSNRVPKWNGSALATGTIYDNGNIGIGITSPLEKLHVRDNGYLQAMFQSINDAAGIALKASSGQQYEIQSLNDGSLIIYDRTDARYTMKIDTYGNVGIGTRDISVFDKLTVAGHVRIDDGLYVDTDLYVVDYIRIGGMTGTTSGSNVRYYNDRLYYYSSSEKYKDDIQPLKEDFHKILKAEPKSFIDKVSGEHNVGYIAEEFEELGLNNLVVYRDGQPDALKYELVSLYLLEVVKENIRTAERLKAENELLKKQLKEQNRSMEERLDAMEKMIKQNCMYSAKMRQNGI